MQRTRSALGLGLLLLFAASVPARQASTQEADPSTPAAQDGSSGQDPSAPPSGTRRPGEAPASPDAQAAEQRNRGTDAQVGQRQSPTIGREEMWRRPSDEDWAKPVLIRWQRTWEDAVQLSQETGKPILIAVNMDGEIASEHYAGIRYRTPEVAALFEPYVSVMASVYRHTPRDHDENGNRIECPRFGTVTCGEHIALEPLVHDKYFDNRRVSPRHVMVELEGQEVYDVYYAFDTASVFDAIREGIELREREPYDFERDPSLEGLVRSTDSADRERVEAMWSSGDRETRRRILAATRPLGAKTGLDLLRLALFDVDIELAAEARRQLAATENPAAIDLVLEALRIPMPEGEREALVAALERLGAQNDRARTLAAVQRGLGSGAREIDVDAWTRALKGTGGGYAAKPRQRGSAERLDAASSSTAGSGAVDGQQRLEFAEASLAYAIEPEAWKSTGAGPVQGTSADEYRSLLLADALNAAEEAERAGVTGWRTDAAIALASWYSGDRTRAEERAAKAVLALPAGATDWNAMAVLSIFAEARRTAIERAVRAKQPWQREWMGDVHAAYSVLGAHPEGSADLIARHFDFMVWMGAFRQAGDVLDGGLERFPLAPSLHQRLRGRLLWQRGAEGLERAYDLRFENAPDDAGQVWFAGLASVIAAESHRKQNAPEAASRAYSVGIERFRRSIQLEPSNRESASHWIAIAMGGDSRLALDAGDLDRSIDLLVDSIATWPDAANVLDGLQLSAVETSRTLLARLDEAGDAEGAQRVRLALESLRPEQLGPAAYEPKGPPIRTPDGRRDVEQK